MIDIMDSEQNIVVNEVQNIEMDSDDKPIMEIKYKSDSKKKSDDSSGFNESSDEEFIPNKKQTKTKVKPLSLIHI